MTDVSLGRSGRRSPEDGKKKRKDNYKSVSGAYSWGEKPSSDGVPAKLFSKIIRFLVWKGLPGLIAMHLCASVFVPEIRVTRLFKGISFGSAQNAELYARAASLGDDNHPCAQAINAAYEDMSSGSVRSAVASKKVLSELDGGCATEARRAMDRSLAMAENSRDAMAAASRTDAGLMSAAPLVEGIRDCESCPTLVRISAGAGIPVQGELAVVEHEFFITQSEVSVGLYRDFISGSAQKFKASCMTFEKANWKKRSKRSAFYPGFEVADDMPASCISADDAVNFADWLSEKTGQVYRLPTSFEWARAAAGQESAVDLETCQRWNAADYMTGRSYPSFRSSLCKDEYATLAPGGNFASGQFDTSNMLGNVWEWVVHDELDSRKWGMIIGGGWTTGPDKMGPSVYSVAERDVRASNIGFRLVREIPETAVTTKSGLRHRCEAGVFTSSC